jgi:hypothetical protein
MTNLKLFSIQFVSIWNRTLAVWNSLLSQQKVKWAIILPKSARNHQKSTSVYHQQWSRKFIRVWNSSSSARFFSCWSISFANMREHEPFKGPFWTHNSMTNVCQNCGTLSKRKRFHLPNGIRVAGWNEKMARSIFNVSLLILLAFCSAVQTIWNQTKTYKSQG